MAAVTLTFALPKLTSAQMVVLVLPIIGYVPISLVSWYSLNSVVGGHVKFQPVGLLLSNMATIMGRDHETAGSIRVRREALKYFFGDISDDNGYAFYARTMARVSYDSGHPAEAEVYDRQALAIQAKVFGSDSQRAMRQTVHLADDLLWLGRYAECEGLYQKAIKFELGQKNVDHRYIAHLQNGLAVGLRLGGHYPEALRSCVDGVENATTAHDQFLVYFIEHLRGIVYQDMGHMAPAEDSYRKALQAISPHYSDSVSAEELRVEIATMQVMQGRSDLAGAARDRALDFLRRNEMKASKNVNFLRALAVLCSETADFDNARSFFDRSIALAMTDGGARRVYLSSMRHDLANMLRRQERFGEAEAIIRDVVSTRLEVLGAGHPETARSKALMDEILRHDSSQRLSAE